MRFRLPFRRTGKPRRGAVIVEFALTFIIFLLLVFFLLDFSRAIWMYTTLAHATRQGARFAMAHGSLHPTTAAEVEAVVAANAVGLDSNLITVTTTWVPSNQRGGVVSVHVAYPFTFAAAGAILGSTTMELRSRSQMVIAN